MSQATAMVLMFVLYGVLPAVGLYLGYRGIQKITKPKLLEYKAMPQLGYIPEKSLPIDIRHTLDKINAKGEKLKHIYGDTNNDGVIDNKDAVTETYVMIKSLMDSHIPEAIADYRRLHDLDERQDNTQHNNASRVNTTKIKHSQVTGQQALLDILNMVNTQFDDWLDASYHQDGQKLLATNRYIKQRFEQK